MVNIIFVCVESMSCGSKVFSVMAQAMAPKAWGLVGLVVAVGPLPEVSSASCE